MFRRCWHQDHQCWDFSEIDGVRIIMEWNPNFTGNLHSHWQQSQRWHLAVFCVAAGIKVCLLKGIPKFLSSLCPTTVATTSAVCSASGHWRSRTVYWRRRSLRPPGVRCSNAKRLPAPPALRLAAELLAAPDRPGGLSKRVETPPLKKKLLQNLSRWNRLSQLWSLIAATVHWISKTVLGATK